MQGDTNALYTFTYNVDIVLDYIITIVNIGREDIGLQLKRRQSRRIVPIVLTDLDFADDIVLVTEEIGQAQVMIYILQEAAGKRGLHCNTKKIVEFSKPIK